MDEGTDDGADGRALRAEVVRHRCRARQCLRLWRFRRHASGRRSGSADRKDGADGLCVCDAIRERQNRAHDEDLERRSGAETAWLGVRAADQVQVRSWPMPSSQCPDLKKRMLISGGLSFMRESGNWSKLFSTMRPSLTLHS